MILRIRDKDGNVYVVPAIKGPKGDRGKSAHETAKEAGYTGTEAELAADLVSISGKAKKAAEPTAGNFAALDADGNLTDSGKKPSDIPVITYGTTAITAGSASSEPEGSLHFVIE